jgi:cytochrome c oxidase cbb3-type subunit 3
MATPSRPPTALVLAAITLSAVILGVVVFRPRAASTAREWTPEDHDQPAGQPQGMPQRQRSDPKQEADAMVESAWTRSCAPCHGARGRGDGPQGPMVHAPDLTRGDWQGRVTDDDLRKTIQNGRNNMPKFDLPAPVLDGLVKRIRANKGS